MEAKPKILLGIPTGSRIEPALLESFSSACVLRPDEGYVSSPQVVPYRVTNQARNILAARMLEGSWTHLFMLDDDMRYPPFTLARLLQEDVDVIAPFYVRKVRGFLPNCFKDSMPTGWRTAWCDKVEEVAAVGTGGILIKRRLFEVLDPPWFTYEPYQNPTKFAVDQKSEDVVFCDKARAAGFKIYCHGAIKCGHVGTFIVTPGLELEDKPGYGAVKVEPYEPLEENNYGY